MLRFLLTTIQWFQTKENVYRFLVVVLLMGFITGLRESYEPVDFIAFLCGGEAIRSHSNPYITTFLNSCEHNDLAIIHYPIVKNVVLPAPLPSYALAFFAVLSYVPPFWALSIWMMLLVSAFIISVVLLCRLTFLPLSFVIAAMSASFFMISLPLGQIVPIIILATCVTLWLLQNNQPNTAGLASIVAMAEPHLGLPLCIGVFLVEPRARMSLLTGLIGLGLVSLAVLPIQTNREYITHVLPMHAWTEAWSDGQYSLTHLLVVAGLEPIRALQWGSLQYFLTIMLGIVATPFILKKTGNRLEAVLFLPTLALVGGPFLHGQQMGFALIVALLLYGRFYGACEGLALCVIAMPLGEIKTSLDGLMYIFIGTIVMLTILQHIKRSQFRIQWILFIMLCAYVAGGLALTKSASEHHVLDTAYHQRALLSLNAPLPPEVVYFGEATWQRHLTSSHTTLGWIMIGVHSLMTIAVLYSLSRIAGSNSGADQLTRVNQKVPKQA